MISTEEKPQEVLQLYEQLCKFNYHRDLDPHRRPLQANPELDELQRTNSQQITAVPLHFSTAEGYVKFWKPLFFEEVKSYVSSCRSTEATKPQKFELLSYFELSQFKIMEFKRLRESAIIYLPGSYILLSPLQILPEDINAPHLLGVVHKSETSLYVRVMLPEAESEQLVALTTSREWFLQGLCTMASIQREFKGLLRFGQIQNCIRDVLLKPQEHKLEEAKHFNIPHALEHKLSKIYNSSQLEAISASLKQEGITLVQGPPGTGKTQTVLATLSVLLQSSVNREQDQQVPLLLRWKTSQQKLVNSVELSPWMLPGYVDWRDQPYLLDEHQPLNLTKVYSKAKRQVTLLSRKEEATAPCRVLVCGPSNASVDEVIRKLLKEQLLDGSGNSYLPSFVRVGQNYHESLQAYSLDALATKLEKAERGDTHAAKKRVLRESRLVFATLSASGSSILESAEVEFDTVVIDEAGQAIEISSLLPLLMGCKRLILIGDPKQLPATVFSAHCLQHHYDQSLFERLMKAGYPVNLLKVQYRMHPEISKVVGSHFYGGQLEDGNVISIEPKGVPNAFFLLHLQNGAEIFGQQSYYNPAEGECVKILVNWLSKHHKDIGVLSPYSAQVKWLNQQKLGNLCEVKTIDSFQGRQKEVIIFSAVRAERTGTDKKQNKKRTIGFVGDGRRLNVALSRAKQLCIVVGDLTRLQINKTWKGIIQQARKRGQAYKVICAQQLRQIGDGLNNLRKF